jgi:hypothetical protein
MALKKTVQSSGKFDQVAHYRLGSSDERALRTSA